MTRDLNGLAGEFYSQATKVPVALAANATINIGAFTTPVLVAGGNYVWSTAGAFNGGTITLQALGPDGSTYINVATQAAASSTQVMIGAGIGNSGTQVRLGDTVANATGIFSALT